ncbi:MAG TPA: hypothetical protein PK443_01320, partial [bacterium]|nr:hypothetical protein [bacterium]
KIFELLVKPDLSHIIETQASVFTLMILSYIFIIEHRPVIDLLIAKSLLNISIFYIGFTMITTTINIKKPNLWLFMFSIIILFFVFLFYVSKYFINMARLWDIDQQWTQTILYIQPIFFLIITAFVLIKMKYEKRNRRGKTTK